MHLQQLSVIIRKKKKNNQQTLPNGFQSACGCTVLLNSQGMNHGGSKILFTAQRPAGSLQNVLIMYSHTLPKVSVAPLMSHCRTVSICLWSRNSVCCCCGSVLLMNYRTTLVFGSFFFLLVVVSFLFVVGSVLVFCLFVFPHLEGKFSIPIVTCHSLKVHEAKN